MKKKLLSLLLSIAVLISFAPLYTIQAEAFSTGSKTFVKTKTVTIKPGKTYNSPKFNLKKKMVIQVPINVDSKSYITKGGYTMSLRNSKKKVLAKYSSSLKNYGEGLTYDNWIYFYKGKKISKPCFSKGKYYISIKNTSNKTIKVKYSVRGYTKFASKAELAKSKIVDYNASNNGIVYLDEFFPYVYVGKIGPGLPVVESIKTSNSKTEIMNWIISYDGKLYISVDSGETEADTVVSVKLKNNKTPYKINVKIKSYSYDDDDYDDYDE